MKDKLISSRAAIDACRESYEPILDFTSTGHTIADSFEDILNALPSAEPERKTEKALRLLVEWAVECGFGYDNIPEEYEKYKDDIADMGYIDGLIYIAKMEVEHG